MRWLVENWHALLAGPWDAITLVLLALGSGAWMGSARPGNEKTAGVRTMALVALGSCASTLVGYAFGDSTGDSPRASLHRSSPEAVFWARKCCCAAEVADKK